MFLERRRQELCKRRPQLGGYVCPPRCGKRRLKKGGATQAKMQMTEHLSTLCPPVLRGRPTHSSSRPKPFSRMVTHASKAMNTPFALLALLVMSFCIWSPSFVSVSVCASPLLPPHLRSHVVVDTMGKNGRAADHKTDGLRPGQPHFLLKPPGNGDGRFSCTFKLQEQRGNDST